MLNLIRNLVFNECGTFGSGEITINEKDLKAYFPNDSYYWMRNSLNKLKNKRCIRFECEFIGEDIYHAKEGEDVYHIKLLKNSMNY